MMLLYVGFLYFTYYSCVFQITDAHIDYSPYTIDFERLLAAGPSVQHGDSLRDVVKHSVKSLITIATRIATDDRIDSNQHFDRTTAPLNAILVVPPLNQALHKIKTILSENWHYLLVTAIGIDNAISPMLRRVIAQWSKISSAEAHRARLVFNEYTTFFTTQLPALQSKIWKNICKYIDDFDDIARKLVANSATDNLVSSDEYF